MHSLSKVIAVAAMAASVVLGPTIISPADAATVDWTLTGVTFDDGGGASGTFSIDTTTGLLTAYNITTTAGTSLAGTLYEPSTSNIFSQNQWSPNSFIITSNASPYINFAFVSPLTSPGFNLFVTSGFLAGSWECFDSSCAPPQRLVVSGAATATPLPAALPLFASGLGLLGFARWRRRRRRRLTGPLTAASPA